MKAAPDCVAVGAAEAEVLPPPRMDCVALENAAAREFTAAPAEDVCAAIEELAAARLAEADDSEAAALDEAAAFDDETALQYKV